MAALNPPWALQNLATHTANVSRDGLLLQSGGAEGVLATSGLGTLAVAQRGAGANMSVDVAAGMVAVMGDENNVQGLYGCVNDATTNVVIAAADPTNPRRDLIVARVQDAFYSGGTNAWSLAVIQGTPAGSPADPAMLNNAVCLARVAVAAGASSIVNANITDLRPFAPLGILPVNSARPPGTLYGPFSQEPAFKSLAVAGLPIFEQDTFSLKHYTTATTGFRPPWNMPWGVVDFVQNTAGQTGINTIVDLTSLTSTQTYVANRRIKITGYLPYADSTTSAVFWQLVIADGSNTQLQVASAATPAASQPEIMLAQVIISPTAGSKTYKLRGLTGTAGGRFTASASGPAFLLIEDIGPNANPA